MEDAHCLAGIKHRALHHVIAHVSRGLVPAVCRRKEAYCGAFHGDGIARNDVLRHSSGCAILMRSIPPLYRESFLPVIEQRQLSDEILCRRMDARAHLCAGQLQRCTDKIMHPPMCCDRTVDLCCLRRREKQRIAIRTHPVGRCPCRALDGQCRRCGTAQPERGKGAREAYPAPPRASPHG